MDQRIALSAVFLLLLSGVAAAQGVPAAPHQFYGDVLVNGQPARDGLLIVARISGVDVAGTTTRNGGYGRSPNIFYIEDPNGNRAGKTVEFFVAGIKGGEAVFQNGFSTKLDLAVTGTICGDGACTSGESCSSCSADCGSCPPAPASTGGGGGGGGSSGGGTAPAAPAPTTTPPAPPAEAQPAPAPCVENWVCTEWLDCFNSKRRRVCADAAFCGTTNTKPAETEACESPAPAAAPLGGVVTAFAVLGDANVIAGIVAVVVLLAVVVLWRRRAKRAPAVPSLPSRHAQRNAHRK